MGLVTEQIVFAGRAPAAAAIADKVAALSGLPVSVEQADAEARGHLFDLCASLASAGAPTSRLGLFAYRAGAGNQIDRKMPEAQTVHLRGFLGQDPTLLFMTVLALEALGGRPRHPLGDDLRREYDGPVTPAELQRRLRRAARQNRLTAAVVLLLVPVLVPLWLVGLLVETPVRTWQAVRLYRRRLQETRKVSDGATTAGSEPRTERNGAQRSGAE